MKTNKNPIRFLTRSWLPLIALLTLCLSGFPLLGYDLDSNYADEPGYIPIDQLVSFESEDVMSEIVLKSSLIKMIAKLTPREEQDFKDMMRFLKLIRVMIFDVNEENLQRMENNSKVVIAYLDDNGWERIVYHREKGENAGIYIHTVDEDTISGLGLVVREKGNKMILVNIVGEINLSMLGQLGERFNIPQLEDVDVEAEAEIEGEE